MRVTLLCSCKYILLHHQPRRKRIPQSQEFALSAKLKIRIDEAGSCRIPCQHFSLHPLGKQKSHLIKYDYNARFIHSSCIVHGRAEIAAG